LACQPQHLSRLIDARQRVLGEIADALADVMFNSETKLGDTKNLNRRLKSLIEDFAKLDLRPSRIVADGQGRGHRHR